MTMSSKRMTIAEAINLYGVNFIATLSLRSKTEYRVHCIVRDAHGYTVGVRVSRYRLNSDKPMSTCVLKMFQIFEISKVRTN